MKVCGGCGQTLELGNFPRSKTCSDGHEGVCRECRKQRRKEKALKNASSIILCEYKTCSQCNITKKIDCFHKRFGAVDGRAGICIDCRAINRAGYQSESEESQRAYKRSWAKENDAKVRAARHNYEARRAGAEGELTPALVELIFEVYGSACLVCGTTEKIHIDHVVPLSLGGSNLPTNLQPLCEFHNKSKRNRSSADYRPFVFDFAFEENGVNI